MQKHNRFREFRTPFRLRDLQHVRACAAGDGDICSKNRKIVPYHGDNPNNRNARSLSLIMAPVRGGDLIMALETIRFHVALLLFSII